MKEGDLLLGITVSARLPREHWCHSVTGFPGKTEGKLPEPLSGQGLFLMVSLILSVPTLLAKGVGVGEQQQGRSDVTEQIIRTFL